MVRRAVELLKQEPDVPARWDIGERRLPAIMRAAPPGERMAYKLGINYGPGVAVLFEAPVYLDPDPDRAHVTYMSGRQADL